MLPSSPRCCIATTDVVIGGRRLHADRRVPQIRKAPDRGRLRAVDHQGQRRCNIIWGTDQASYRSRSGVMVMPPTMQS